MAKVKLKNTKLYWTSNKNLSSYLQFTLLICETFIHFCPRGKSIGDFQDAAELGKFNVLIDKFPYIALIAVV